MKVVSVIKEGKHYPSFWNRLKYLRVWVRPFGLPIAFRIINLKIEYAKNDRYIPEDVAPFVLTDKETAYNVQLYNQINKISGLAYGMPRYSKEYKSIIHPWSIRVGWRLVNPDDLAKYVYRDGKRLEAKCQSEEQVSMRMGALRFWFAYSLHPFFGGESPAPCDIKISYEIEFYKNKGL